MKRLLVRARCECHVWIVSVFDRLGRCGRCGRRPVSEGAVTDGEGFETTVCLHEGDCDPR